jgi:predicted small metal-binding protein
VTTALLRLSPEEEAAMKDMHCRDAGMNCDFVARGNTEKEILDQASQHAQQAHSMKMTPDMEQQVRGLIHDESSEAHRRSTSKAGTSR